MTDLEMWRAWKAGKTQAEIAAETRKHERTVRRALRRAEQIIAAEDTADADGEEHTLDPNSFADPERVLRDRGYDPELWEAHVRLTERDTDEGIQRTAAVTIKPRPRLVLPAAPAHYGAPFVIRRPKLAAPAARDHQLVVLPADPHGLHIDRGLNRIFERWCQHNQPDRMVILGDVTDQSKASRHDDTFPERWTAEPQEEVDFTFDTLAGWVAANKPGIEIELIPGNHDRNIEQYLLRNAPALRNLRPAHATRAALSIENLLRLDELGIRLVTHPDGHWPHPHVTLVPNLGGLVVSHGDRVAQGSGNSARKQTDNQIWGEGLGHVHRMGWVLRRLGDGTVLQSFEAGTMRDINSGFLLERRTDWQQGFVTVRIWPDGTHHVEFALYRNGVLTWNGQRYEES